MTKRAREEGERRCMEEIRALAESARYSMRGSSPPLLCDPGWVV